MRDHVIIFAYPLIDPATLLCMRETRRRIGNVAKSGLMPDETPLWMQHARAYKREPSVAEDHEVITGYATFHGLRGSEANALQEAVKAVKSKARVHEHHQRAYTFVILTSDEATKVERQMRRWNYSPQNQVDLLRRSLDLEEKAVTTRRTGRRARRAQQSEVLFK